MKRENKTFIELLFWLSIAGNILFVLWVTFNGVKEGFRGTLPEKASYVGLMGLLVINCFLLFRGRKIEQNFDK